MDTKYDEASTYYRFTCHGPDCDNNCCQSLFFHHTYIEYLYLYDGYLSLDDDKKADIGANAVFIADQMRKSRDKRFMCPLNYNGLCELYRFRPMICRLHGLPHILRLPPGGCPRKSPGCDIFYQDCSERPDFAFDRDGFLHGFGAPGIGAETKCRYCCQI